MKMLETRNIWLVSGNFSDIFLIVCLFLLSLNSQGFLLSEHKKSLVPRVHDSVDTLQYTRRHAFQRSKRVRFLDNLNQKCPWACQGQYPVLLWSGSPSDWGRSVPDHQWTGQIGPHLSWSGPVQFIGFWPFLSLFYVCFLWNIWGLTCPMCNGPSCGGGRLVSCMVCLERAGHGLIISGLVLDWPVGSFI